MQIVPGYYHEASVVAAARQAESGALAMHPYDQPEVVAGAGTVGLELAEQVPDADTVLVAVGGGGLIAGVASWFRGDVRVVGVEPEACPTLHDALGPEHRSTSRWVGSPPTPWDRDASAPSRSPLRAHGSSGSSWCPMRRSATHNAGCGDDAHLVAEPGGAASLAALIADAYRPAADERVVVVVCGANTDPASVV